MFTNNEVTRLFLPESNGKTYDDDRRKPHFAIIDSLNISVIKQGKNNIMPVTAIFVSSVPVMQHSSTVALITSSDAINIPVRSINISRYATLYLFGKHACIPMAKADDEASMINIHDTMDAVKLVIIHVRVCGSE